MILLNNQIHLWFAYDKAINDTRLINMYKAVLNEEEKEKYSRIVFSSKRHQYLVTRAMVRYILSLYESEIPPNMWSFAGNKYGKPHISNCNLNTPLMFNIAHCEGLVVVAVTNGQEIGVDAEWVYKCHNIMEISDTYFDPSEIEYIACSPSQLNNIRFYELWTLKEAYMKACGEGFSIPLNQFRFKYSQSGKATIHFNSNRVDHSELWKFWHIQPNDDYSVALALKSREIADNYVLTCIETTPMLDFHTVQHRFTIHNEQNNPSNIYS